MSTNDWYCDHGNLRGHGVGDPQAQAGHGGKELLEALGVAVEGVEEVAAVLGLVLRLSRLQAFGEVGPEAEEAGAHHLQHAAHVRRLGPVQVEIGRGRVGVLALLALEHAQGDQRVEEIARAALVKVEPGPDVLQRQRPLGQLREQAQLHRTEQRLGAPVPEAQLHDRIGRNFLSHQEPPRMIGSTGGVGPKNRSIAHARSEITLAPVHVGAGQHSVSTTPLGHKGKVQV